MVTQAMVFKKFKEALMQLLHGCRGSECDGKYGINPASVSFCQAESKERKSHVSSRANTQAATKIDGERSFKMEMRNFNSANLLGIQIGAET